MEIEEIKQELSKIKEFSNIDDWKFKAISMGETEHTYEVSNKSKKYFVKEIKSNEARILWILSSLNLKHLPGAAYPSLLEKLILVRDFIPGKPIKSKKLEPGLIKDFAVIQNRLNDKGLFKKYDKFGDRHFNTRDDGFFRRGISDYFSFCPRRLAALKKYDLQVVDDFKMIYQHLKKEKKQILDEFSGMPFARQHHDFREDNIVGRPQKLIDWGSSYGHGPFMFDLAPFLIGNKKSLETYIKYSDICKQHTREEIDRFVYVGAAVRFIEFIRWRTTPGDNFKSMEECRKFLEHEYKTYRLLLE